MTTFKLSRVRIAGVGSAVPKAMRVASDEAESFPGANIEKLAASTGVVERHVSPKLCASDLGEAAAKRVLEALGWDPKTVDVLIFVTQMPDYRLPANACLLQARLGLSDECVAFDVNLGCSGFVYGLAQAAGLLSTIGRGRALLVAGDTSSHWTAPQDKSTVFLFGDGVAAMALEHDAGAAPMHFTLGTDGTGGSHLIVPAGGFRCPSGPGTGERKAREGGNIRSDEDLTMNGAEVFAFSLKRVPPLIEKTLAAAGWQNANVDAFVFHQANQMMLKLLGKKLGITDAQMPLSLDKYGNTSSASIPITLSHCLPDKLSSGAANLVMVGFGVGFSWGAAAVSTANIAVPEVVLVEEGSP
jgi:3-oxoacyl-[acyl-carrier-protein] synthase-3